jgi:biopolymer transport protein ExbD
MARKKNQASDASDVELNMTPMIDVVFNLIIFFMIVTDMTQKELEQLTLPNSTQAVEDTGDESERRVIINIVKKNPDTFAQDKEVEIFIKKQPYDLDRLKEHLFTHAETARDMDHPSQPSEIFVLIRCDEEIRWREVQWVMQACADPAVRIYKLQFATRKRDTDK